MNSIRRDMSQIYLLKAAFEQILGKRTYRKLKETATLSDWKMVNFKLRFVEYCSCKWVFLQSR